MSDFFRYPQTPHLVWLGSSAPRDDKVLGISDANLLLRHSVTVEEKLDGANVGISVDPSGDLRFQNRGQYLRPPFTGQFSRLNGWAAQYGEALTTVLAPGLVLFGEWLAARHSVEYDKLPGWFVAFDIHETAEDAFWSIARRNEMVRAIGLPVAPCLLAGQTSLTYMVNLVTTQTSRFANAPVEGLIVRQDDLRLNRLRAKLVRPDFVQSMGEHWRRRALEWNRICKIRLSDHEKLF